MILDADACHDHLTKRLRDPVAVILVGVDA